VKRDFTANAPNLKWVGGMTEIPTIAGKLYLATVIDLFSRELLSAATRYRSIIPGGRRAGQSQPRSWARRAAALRLVVPSLWMASDR